MWTQVFQLVDSKTIGTQSGGISAGFQCVHNLVRSERSGIVNKSVSPPNTAHYNSCCRIWTVRCWSRELPREMSCYLPLVGVAIIAEDDRLVWGCEGAFP